MAELTPGMAALLSLTCAAGGLVFVVLAAAVGFVKVTDELTEWLRDNAPRFGEWIHRSPWTPPGF